MENAPQVELFGRPHLSMPERPPASKYSRLFQWLVDQSSILLFSLIMLLFILISILLVCLAFDRLIVTALAFPDILLDSLFETIGFTTIAVAVFELALTMYDEEIKSPVHMNAPMKIRHFISRFLTVIVISLSIEFLTMVFRYSHKPDEFVYLYEAAAVAAGVAFLFGAWALYNRTSVTVEKFEHELERGVSEMPGQGHK